MCGIICILNNNSNKNDSDTLKQLMKTYEECKKYITRRGPDFQSIKTATLDNYSFFFAASVLWLQGCEITEQPIETDSSVFVYNGDFFDGMSLPNILRRTEGDTSLFLKCLENSEDISSTLLNIQGPYAFIYLNKRKSKLYFCRDMYGRRSLVIGRKGTDLLLTSVALKTAGFRCLELPTLGVFCYDLRSEQFEMSPWKFKHSNFNMKLNELEVFLDQRIFLKDQNGSVHPKNFVAPTEADLVLFQQLKAIKYQEAFSVLFKNKAWLNNVEILQRLLEVAVEKRIATQPKYCHKCIIRRDTCNHALTGVLYSGGVDCAVIALLADKFTDKERPIDLLNVAFNPAAPDRITGRETLKELEHLRPDRKWNFVAINVTHDELELERRTHIADLIYPLNTILDDSLGCALWFASRGQAEDYQSPCRVLLVGMGADELFGGYTKHRAALRRGGWPALNESLEDDWQNISHRNLARDDRVVSDHGRQLRTPYLDENVVDFVRNLNCWERTCPSEVLPQGLGEKILLRSLAYFLGLENASCLKKRALQFGSRIANSRENAHDVSPRL